MNEVRVRKRIRQVPADADAPEPAPPVRVRRRSTDATKRHPSEAPETPYQRPTAMDAMALAGKAGDPVVANTYRSGGMIWRSVRVAHAVTTGDNTVGVTWAAPDGFTYAWGVQEDGVLKYAGRLPNSSSTAAYERLLATYIPIATRRATMKNAPKPYRYQK